LFKSEKCQAVERRINYCRGGPVLSKELRYHEKRDKKSENIDNSDRRRTMRQIRCE